MLMMEPDEVLAKVADFPIRMFERGDIVLSEGTMSGRLLFLKGGAVDIVKDDVLITRVTELGAVFGEMAFLLGQPHTADVLAIQPSSFYVVEDPEAFLKGEPLAGLYIAVVLAARLNAVNLLLIEARNEVAKASRGRAVEMLNRLRQALHIRTPG